MNSGRTKYISYNTNQQFEIKAIDGPSLKRVEDLKYLGAWVDSSEKYVKIRKAQAWRTCHQMRNIWNSNFSRKLKSRLMIATFESVLLYDCETWTPFLYGALERLSNNIKRRRLKFAGHCLRREDDVIK